MVLLLGCPAVGDGAVEQERRKGATNAAAGLSYSGRRTSGATKKKGKDREGKKTNKKEKNVARDKRRKYQSYPPTVIAAWFVSYFRKGHVCTVK